ncbi:MAG: NADPH:quinone reductase [Beijerinckiaceae bacterium]
MLAGWYERTGLALDVIETGEMPIPEPGPGEVLVRLHASGINPSDYKKRGNSKVAAEFPRVIPHSDGAGVLAGLGAGVTGFRTGERVWTFNAQWGRPCGTAAEYVALPADRISPLNEGTPFAEGACLGIPAMTGCRVIFLDGPVEGQTIYVPAATGRVGAYALQFAKWGGARVIASAGNAERAAIAAALGADHVIDRSREDVVGRILELTGGRGVDRVAEVEFGGNMPVNAQILAQDGVISSYASAHSPKAEIIVSPRRARNMSIHFVFVYMLNPKAIEDTCALVNKADAAGALKHRIAGTFPLAQLAQAHAQAERESGTGHMIVTMD